MWKGPTFPSQVPNTPTAKSQIPNAKNSHNRRSRSSNAGWPPLCDSHDGKTHNNSFSFLSDPVKTGVRSLGPDVRPTPSWDLTDVTLAEEDTNSIPADKANRAIQGNVAMQWCNLVANFRTNASGTTSCPNFEQIQIMVAKFSTCKWQVAPSSDQICDQFK